MFFTTYKALKVYKMEQIKSLYMNQNYKDMKIKVYCESTRSGIMGTGGTETTETEFVTEFEAESREAIERFKIWCRALIKMLGYERKPILYRPTTKA